MNDIRFLLSIPLKGKNRTEEYPEKDYTFYHDYGNLFESVTLKEYEMGKKYLKATQRIYHTQEYPSHLLLLVVKIKYSPGSFYLKVLVFNRWKGNKNFLPRGKGTKISYLALLRLLLRKKTSLFQTKISTLWIERRFSAKNFFSSASENSGNPLIL